MTPETPPRMALNAQERFARWTRGIQRARIADIELVKTRPQAKQAVLDTYTALRKFMTYCNVTLPASEGKNHD